MSRYAKIKAGIQEATDWIKGVNSMRLRVRLPNGAYKNLTFAEMEQWTPDRDPDPRAALGKEAE